MCTFFEEHDVLDDPPTKTPFQQRREAARNYQDLVQLGIDEDMDFPEAWAKHVLAARENRL